MTSGDRQRTAVVTGGTSGIGREIAADLARHGFAVIVTGRSAPKDDLTDGIEFLCVDHADATAPQIIADHLDAHGRRVAALVNNVGRRDNSRIDELDFDAVLQTLTINLVSHMVLTRTLSSRFGDDGGAIVNISSRLARVGMSGVSAYAASKGALNAFTRCAAVELAPRHIRVNAVSPGMTRTPLIDGWLHDQDDPAAAEQTVVGRVPLGRLATPRDVAGAVSFLCSAAAAYLTGVVLPVDGGYTIA